MKERAFPFSGSPRRLCFLHPALASLCKCHGEFFTRADAACRASAGVAAAADLLPNAPIRPHNEVMRRFHEASTLCVGSGCHTGTVTQRKPRPIPSSQS